MATKALVFSVVTVGALAAIPMQAAACDPVPGMLIGGGIGAAIGNAPGAAVGAIIGSAITGSAPCYGYRDGGYDRGYVERRYERDRYYAPAPTYYAPAPTYYAPAPRYYEPAPRVVYPYAYPAPVVYVSRAPRHRYYYYR